MGDDDTDPTSISQLENRMVPVQRIKQAKHISSELRVQQARETLASLVAKAENPPLQLRTVFDVKSLGKLTTTALRGFRLVDEKTAAGTAFTLCYEHRGRESLKHVTESEDVHKAVRRALYQQELRFRSASSMTVHRIELEPVVPASVSILVDPSGAKVTITLNNVHMIGSASYDLALEALDRKLVDALVNLVTRGDHSFFQMVTTITSRRG